MIGVTMGFFPPAGKRVGVREKRNPGGLLVEVMDWKFHLRF